MATILHPDSDVELLVDPGRLHEGVEMFPSGCFDQVPIAEGAACGYSMYVDDEGLLLRLPINTPAMTLSLLALERWDSTGVPLVGPAFVCSHEEMEEDDLIGLIDEELRRSFEQRLYFLTERVRAESN